MKYSLMIIVACVGIALTACVVEPYGQDVRRYNNDRSQYSWPGAARDEPGQRESSRPVWRQ